VLHPKTQKYEAFFESLAGLLHSLRVLSSWALMVNMKRCGIETCSQDSKCKSDIRQKGKFTSMGNQ
jgi:hypothetical protein